MSEIAKASGLNARSALQALRADAQPRFDTITPCLPGVGLCGCVDGTVHTASKRIASSQAGLNCPFTGTTIFHVFFKKG